MPSTKLASENERMCLEMALFIMILSFIKNLINTVIFMTSLHLYPRF